MKTPPCGHLLPYLLVEFGFVYEHDLYAYDRSNDIPQKCALNRIKNGEGLKAFHLHALSPVQPKTTNEVGKLFA